ncbi:MAG: ATP-binding protein, partial [Candidatus Cyclonatronum sp.]|uniref:ATP-binding protein n=1 Tax=Cyclonatronum sp. TaxID=3024185 RepID=UPI0025B86C68
MIRRSIQDSIQKLLFKGKVIILYGARRTGKTTLSKALLAGFGDEARYINCEILQYRQALETTNTALLNDFLGNYKVIVLDEAQSIPNIGLTLKVLADTRPDIQLIATGSSSFDMAQSVSEPLTGRSRTFTLYPFSLTEISQETLPVDWDARLENMLRFGMYPDVYGQPEEEALEELRDISTNYLYKDVLQFNQLKRSDLLFKLLQALALQLGHEVSYNELAKLLGENHHTIRNYIELLEKSFVVFRLGSFSRNLRKELSKSFKVYFLDNGIRNSLINNFNPLSQRDDTGALWENFCVTERMKLLHNQRQFPNRYFWRTYDRKEIDYLEEAGG